MLRIVTKQSGKTYRIELHGTLGGDWIELLEDHWRSIMWKQPSAAVVVILSEVEFIDAAGERLLGRMAGQGVDFIVSGCMNRYVVEKLRPSMAQRQ